MKNKVVLVLSLSMLMPTLSHGFFGSEKLEKVVGKVTALVTQDVAQNPTALNIATTAALTVAGLHFGKSAYCQVERVAAGAKVKALQLFWTGWAKVSPWAAKEEQALAASAASAANAASAGLAAAQNALNAPAPVATTASTDDTTRNKLVAAKVTPKV
jgi:hypothetical protein